MADWPSNVEFIAEVMPDWTTLQLSSGQAFAFNRETGRVYRVPHPECPFAIIPHPGQARPAPTDEQVEAAARRMWEVAPNFFAWDIASESVRDKYRRMASAALGIT